MGRYHWACALLLVPATSPAGDPPAAKLRSPIGTVLQRGGEKSWLAPMLYDSVPAGAQLVTPAGARGILEIKEGDARLVLAGNLPVFSTGSVLESVVTLQPASTGSHDLEFILDRGRVVIENHRESGALKVRVRIYGKNLDFDLLDNKTSVALELSSRWPAGSPFLKKPKADHKPVRDLILVVAGGKTAIALNNETQSVSGPAMYRFNTERGIQGPLGLKAAPAWIKPDEDQPVRIKTLQTAVEKLRRGIAEQGALAALAQAGASGDIPLRILAAYDGTALDQPAAGIAALYDGKAEEVRAAGVDALQQYSGRGSAEDVRLYEVLVETKVKAGQAGIILELLHGLGEEARLRPETFETLITYLQNDQIAIRELAARNLRTLAPQGKGIAFDAGGTAEERGRAQAAWRQLIPNGQVPR